MLKKTVDLTEQHSSFGGTKAVWCHRAETLQGDAIYVPDHDEGDKLPVSHWLSGLTCTEQNFITKASAQRYVPSTA